jgi:hypothetical protein
MWLSGHRADIKRLEKGEKLNCHVNNTGRRSIFYKLDMNSTEIQNCTFWKKGSSWQHQSGNQEKAFTYVNMAPFNRRV